MTLLPSTDFARDPRCAQRMREDAGWVMVPVISLLAIALALSFAALLLVDRQTSAARAERSTDAAQTLAEGVLTATASTLAGDRGQRTWDGTFPLRADGTIRCTQITGDLRSPAAAGTPLETAVRTAVVEHFRATGDDSGAYTERGGMRTTWRVELCPTADDGTDIDVRWDESFRRRGAVGGTAVRTGSIGNLKTMWVRAQAEVGSTAASASSDGVASRLNGARAVVAKVRQDGANFTPPKEYAIGTGSFSTDLGNQVGALVQNITNSNLLLGGLIGDVLGTSGPQLIEDDAAKVGVRCGILTGLQDSTSDVLDLQGPLIDHNTLDLNLCLGGAFSGLNGIGQRTGLNALLQPLGITSDRYTNLNGMTMAPEPAIEAYRSAAKRLGGVFRATVPGGGNVRTKAVGGVPDCFDAATWNTLTSTAGGSGKVVFIEQVGDGEQYCRIPSSRTGANAVTAKAFVVERGGIIVEGTLNSVLYAMNTAECATANATSGCTSNHRRQQERREVVRVVGSGQVNGSVWTDGAKSEVGLYPQAPTEAQFRGALGPLVDKLTSSTDNLLCSVVNGSPILGAVLNPLLDVLNFLIVDVVVAILYKHETMIVPAGAPAPTYFSKPNPANRRQLGCAIVGNTIKALTPSNLLGLLGSGGQTPPLGMDQYERDCVLATLICGAWTKTVRTEEPITLPPGILDAVLGPVAGLASNLLDNVANLFRNKPPMVQRDVGIIENAWVPVPENAALYPGSYRNVPPARPLPAS